MNKKIIAAIVTSAFLFFAAAAGAEPVTVVYHCKLNDDKTKEEAMATNAKWLKWARAKAGTDKITSSYMTAVIGDFGGFMWVDTYPSAAAWAKIADADFEKEQPELSAAFDDITTCKGNKMYRGEETVPAK